MESERCGSHLNIKEKAAVQGLSILTLLFYEKIYLLTAYPKNEKDNLTKEERNAIKKLVDRLEKSLSEKKGG